MKAHLSSARRERSDVPAAEVEAAWADDAVPTSPFDRFILVRSAVGPLGPQSSSWSEGAVQPGAILVHDPVAHLEVDYLHDGEVVATEVLDLPQT